MSKYFLRNHSPHNYNHKRDEAECISKTSLNFYTRDFFFYYNVLFFYIMSYYQYAH